VMRRDLAIAVSRMLAGTMTILGLMVAADDVRTSAWEIISWPRRCVGAR
jgi:hypothetical protein